MNEAFNSNLTPFGTYHILHILLLAHFPSLPDLPPISFPTPPVAEPQFEFSGSYIKFPLAICFTYGIVNFYVTLSIHLPLSLLSSHHVHRSVLYVCFSIAALQINSSVPSFRFHIYALAYDICLSVSDLLHSV